MSLLYGLATPTDPSIGPQLGKRRARARAARPRRSVAKKKETLANKPYVVAIAALVPAEILAAHAALLSVTTTTSKVGGESQTMITEAGTLKWAFIALTVLAGATYLAGRVKSPEGFDWWDPVRTLIAASGFVVWTMLQKSTAFDAIAPGMRDAPRFTIAILSAVVLGGMATLLAYKVGPDASADDSKAA